MIDPRAAAAIDGLACVAMRKGRYAEAQQLLLRAYEIDPRYTRALAHLSYLYERTGRKAAAEAAFRRAIEEDPLDLAARNNYAVFLADTMVEPAPA